LSPHIRICPASNFSFLRGASHPEELMVQAASIGLAGLGLCDRNSVAGVVRAHLAKREQNLTLRYHPGARLVFADNTPDILVYPRNRAGWGRLTRLLTLGNLRAEKGKCILHLDDLLSHAFGLELIAMGGHARFLARLREAALHRIRLAASMLYRGHDRTRLARTKTIARDAQVPDRRQRCALSPSRPAAACRRAHLHPRKPPSTAPDTSSPSMPSDI
jgi:error-prone DNA polymerase